MGEKTMTIKIVCKNIPLWFNIRWTSCVIWRWWACVVVVHRPKSNATYLWHIQCIQCIRTNAIRTLRTCKSKSKPRSRNVLIFIVLAFSAECNFMTTYVQLLLVVSFSSTLSCVVQILTLNLEAAFVDSIAIDDVNFVLRHAIPTITATFAVDRLVMVNVEPVAALNGLILKLANSVHIQAIAFENKRNNYFSPIVVVVPAFVYQTVHSWNDAPHGGFHQLPLAILLECLSFSSHTHMDTNTSCI